MTQKSSHFFSHFYISMNIPLHQSFFCLWSVSLPSDCWQQARPFVTAHDTHTFLSWATHVHYVKLYLLEGFFPCNSLSRPSPEWNYYAALHFQLASRYQANPYVKFGNFSSLSVTCKDSSNGCGCKLRKGIRQQW